MSRPRRWLLLSLVPWCVAARVEAAPTTWADPAGLCNGETPCFTTLAAAVANAGPAPATVLVFPGTYAESVDLLTMGSAIGGGPGQLEVVSVDAAGQPAPGAVVDAGAPGGPGTGPAIEAATFPGELTLVGLVLHSPDSHGLVVLLSGFGLTLDQLVANNNPSNGVLVVQDPDAPSEVLAREVQADGNGDSGVVLGADRVTLSDVTARNNGANGIALFGRLIAGQRLVAEANSESGVAASLGFGAAICTLSDLIVRGNGVGLEVFPDASATSTSGEISQVAAVSNLEVGIFALTDVLTASALTATANQQGILLLGEERLEASVLHAVGNSGIGIGASAPHVLLDELVAEDNVIGIAAEGVEVQLLGSTASGSGPAGDDPHDGTGFVIAANHLVATNNLALGNVLGWRFEDTEPSASSPFDLPVRLQDRIAQIAPRGVSLPPQRLSLLRTHTEANLSASMEVRLRPQGAMQVACSNFLANGEPGFDLQTLHTVDARFNFWGSASGPRHPGNPGGSGDPVQDGNNGGLGTVSFGGFLAQPATDEDCPAVAQVEVPVLGPIGVLLLALALAGAGLRRLKE